MTTQRRPLADYLAREYRVNVIAGYPDEGGYVIEFPDLPACMTSIESLDELVPMANEDGVSLNQYVVALLATGTPARTDVFSNGHGYPTPSIASSPDSGDMTMTREMASVAS